VPGTPDEIRMNLLDELAESFKAAAQKEANSSLRAGPTTSDGLLMAYHHTRAVAHDFGIHLTSCTEGRRTGDARRRWDDDEDKVG
jgi:hypothetical protein